MNFIEEKTPKGFIIKIMFGNWNFSIFGSKGETIYLSDENKASANPVPSIVLIGNTFLLKRNYHADYYMLKVKNGNVLIPYKDILEDRLKYAEVKYNCNIDMVPAKIIKFKNMAEMIHDIDIQSAPDIVCVDNSIPEYEVIIIKQRYKIDEVYKLRNEDVNVPSTQRARNINLNMISSNIVFLAIIHIRNIDISKMNQLMLDFEITEFEIEYILTLIKEAYIRDNIDERSRYMLESLKEAFTFYSHLLVRNDEAIRKMIESQNDESRAAFLKTLVMKINMLYASETDKYSEYEIMLLNKIEELYAKAEASNENADGETDFTDAKVDNEEESFLKSEADFADSNSETDDDFLSEPSFASLDEDDDFLKSEPDDLQNETDYIDADNEDVVDLQSETDLAGILENQDLSASDSIEKD